ncbi:MAG: MogA/MoaB family molybdenum cofactor biosynthesis protein [Planctomycetota bacterium]
MGVEEHRTAAESVEVRVAVVTVSDTRGPDDDPSGDLIAGLLTEAGMAVAERIHIPDDLTTISNRITPLVNDDHIDAVICTGGTGIAERDVTPEAVGPLINRPMPAFEALFAQLSFAEVGPAALLSRATAGIADRTFIAALPGSPKAVRLAVEQLLVPELRHIVKHLRRT